jgi:hypothetical protein
MRFLVICPPKSIIFDKFWWYFSRLTPPVLQVPALITNLKVATTQAQLPVMALEGACWETTAGGYPHSWMVDNGKSHL